SVRTESARIPNIHIALSVECWTSYRSAGLGFPEKITVLIERIDIRKLNDLISPYSRRPPKIIRVLKIPKHITTAVEGIYLDTKSSQINAITTADRCRRMDFRCSFITPHRHIGCRWGKLAYPLS